jgi:hypothetical protein
MPNPWSEEEEEDLNLLAGIVSYMYVILNISGCK